MIALIRYTTASMLHSQRYLAPVLLFLAVVGISSSNDGGPLPPTYALCAGELFVCATWFTIALLSIEDPAHRSITIVSAGNSRRVLLASVGVAVISCSVLAVFGLALPVLVGAHAVTLSDLVLGIEAELACAAMGISIGLLCSRLVIRRQGYALFIALSPRSSSQRARSERMLSERSPAGYFRVTTLCIPMSAWGIPVLSSETKHSRT